MAMEVVAPSAMARPFPTNGIHGQPLVDEFAELEKIVKLRDAIYADKHPRFKPPHSTNPTLAQKVQNSGAQTVVTETPRPFIPQAPRVPRPINTSGKPTATIRTQTLVDPELNDVLLAKSDVLIKAENNLKRDRIERELKQQLENKAIEERLRAEGRNRDTNDDDLDVESILARAQALVNNFGSHDSPSVLGFPSRKKRSLDDLSDAMSIDQLQYDDRSLTNMDKENDMGEQNSVDHDMMEVDRVGPRMGSGNNGNGSEMAKHKEKVLNNWSGPATPPSATESRRPRTPQTESSPRVVIDLGRPKGIANPLDRGNDAPPLVRHSNIRERAAPMEEGPRYSAIRTEEPVAPQPMRAAAAAAVTRMADQDLVIDLRDDEVEDRSHETAHKESRRSPFIKAEPNTRPPSIVGASRRSLSPDGRSIRVDARRGYHEYAEISRYHYPHALLPAHVHPTYDPYYRAPYPYPLPPPPPEYSARSYGGVYSSRYPLYDDYSRLYHPAPHVISMPPLPPLAPPRSPEPLRQSSRAPERRLVSPELHRRRHSSRSLSPRRILDVRPTIERAVSRAQSLVPSSHRDYYERHLLPGPPPPGHYVDPYHPGYYVAYPPPERPVYYDEGRYYAAPPRPLPPLPHYLGELPPPTPRDIREGSVAPRAAMVTSYRDRDYFYPPSSPMPPPPRPHAAVDYREYRELPRDAQDTRSRSVRPDVVRLREEDYVRAVSVRPESHRHGYPPPLQAYTSPAAYRAMSARPETSREVPPPPRGEERVYMRGAIDAASRDREEEARMRERAEAAAEDHRRYREMEEQRRYRDVEDPRRYSRPEPERGRAPAGYQDPRYSPRR